MWTGAVSRHSLEGVRHLSVWRWPGERDGVRRGRGEALADVTPSARPDVSVPAGSPMRRWGLLLPVVVGRGIKRGPLDTDTQDQPALATLQTDYASVDISPTYQELAPGGTTTFTVGASSSSGGAVVVSVPSGLELLGSPVCSGGCRAPFTNVGAEETSMEFNIDGQIATLGFTVALGRSFPAGSSLFITAYLVGGPQAIEQSSATIVVTDTVHSQSPPLSDDNRMVFLDIAPTSLRISPGGDSLYRIWTGLWGMWSNQSPGVEVSIHVPDGLTESAEPACGRGDGIPIQGWCESIERIEDGSGTKWVIIPG